VSLRLARLRVLDGDPSDPDTPAVTYCLDAAGLTVAVSSGPGGYPAVLITPEDHLSGTPITVRIEAVPARRVRADPPGVLPRSSHADIRHP
jgi:hypothetical protein